MLDDLPDEYCCKSCQPDCKQDPCKITLRRDYDQRTGQFHIALMNNIKIVRNQPEHGAGSGADNFPQEWEDKQQYQIIQTDMQKNRKAGGKRHFGGTGEAVKIRSENCDSD